MSMLRETLAEIVGGGRGTTRTWHFLDGRELFGDADVADLPDGTHPNAAGYLRIGERFAAAAFGPGAFHGPPPEDICHICVRYPAMGSPVPVGRC